MRIIPISVYKCSKISFGELDGEPYSTSLLMSTAEYVAKKEKVNERFDKMKSYILKTGDGIEMSSNALRKQLSSIEILRKIELSKLEAEYKRH